MRFTWEVVGLTSLVAVSGALVDGCSLVVDGPKVQCSTDGDCAAEFGAGHSCLQNRCLQLECRSTDDCVKSYGYEFDPENGVGGDSIYANMAGFGKPVGVDANAAGVSPFKPLKVPSRICAVGSCVRIREEGDAHCVNDGNGKQLLFGDPNVANPIVVGFVGDVTSKTPNNPNQLFDPKFLQEGDDIRAAALPLLFARSYLSDVLLVGCSQQRNATSSANPAAQHLLALGAKAIVGPTLSSTFGQAAEAVRAEYDAKGRLMRSGTPLFGPWVLQNSAASVRGTEKLLFFPGPFAQDVLAPLNAVVADRERLIRAKRGLGPTDSLKVFAYYFSAPPDANRVGSNFSEYKDLQPLIAQNLKINGRAAAEQPESFQTFVSDGTGKSVASAVAAIIQQKPDIIIPFTGMIEWDAAFPSIEAAGFNPQYVHPFIFFETSYVTQPLIQENRANILSRVTGIRPTRAAAFEAFKDQLKREFGISTDDLDFKLGLGRAYDASLLLFYGLYAARAPSSGQQLLGPNEFTGADLANAIQRVTDVNAEVLDANPGNFTRGISLLNNGKNMKLVGLHSTMVFDNIGHSPIVWESWCIDTAKAKRNVPNRTIGADGSLGSTPSTSCSDQAHADL